MLTPTPDFWKVFKETSGALSCTEALAIMNIAAQAPEGGWAVELGTHKGKSAMVAMLSLKTEFFMLLDPIFEDSKIISELEKSAIKFYGKIKVKYCTDYSTDFLPKFAPYSYVFVDSGSHQDGLPMQEVRLLEDSMVIGGIIAFHDFDSQFKEVREAYDYLVSTGKYEPIHIDWNEIITYVNENNLEEGNNSWHHTELKNPCFVGAVKRK